MDPSVGAREPEATDPDVDCRAIAGGQFGVIARFQASTFLTPKAIQHRVRARIWREASPGVYVIQGAPPSHQQEIMTAALWVMARRATRQLSCVSHTTAAYLLGLYEFSLPIHVITPRNMSPETTAIIMHRMEVDPVDIHRVGPFPVTTVARTILDLGAVLEIDAVESCLEKALLRRNVSVARLEWQLDRSGRKGTRGAATLRRLLEDRGRGYIPSESELELRLSRLLRESGLPQPVKQKVVKDGMGRSLARVDFCYPSHRLVIEVHGWKYHSEKKRWERDLERGNELVLKGERVLVFTWSDVVGKRQQVARMVRDALRLTDPQGSLELKRPDRSP